MQTWRIVRALDRIQRLRLRLQDFERAPAFIPCPPGMRTADYWRAIDRLERLEQYVHTKLLAGLSNARKGPKRTQS